MTLHGPYTAKPITARTVQEAENLDQWAKWVRKERIEREHRLKQEQAIRKFNKTRF